MNKIITLLSVIILFSCQKEEIVVVDNSCQYTDTVTGHECHNKSVVNIFDQRYVADNTKLCQEHYVLKYTTPTPPNTEQDNTQENNNSSYNGNCQNSYSVTCGARTKKGTSCKNKTRSCNGSCHLHGGQHKCLLEELVHLQP